MADPLRASISIRDIPEAIWELRHEMAEILREEGKGEAPNVTRKLLAIAAAFESGSGGTDGG